MHQSDICHRFAMFLLVLLSFIVIVCILHLYFRYCHAGRLIAEVPGPKGLPLIGNILQILLPPDELFLFARKLNNNYGSPIVKLTSFNIRVVNIYTPNDVEKILSSTRFIEKREPYNFLVPWLGQGLLVSNGQKWHQRRKLLTSAFHFKILKQFSYTIIQQTEELLNRLQEETRCDKTNLLPIITKATLRIMCETSMGTSMREGIESASNKYFQAILTLGHCVMNRMIRPWLYSDWVFALTATSKTQNSALKYLHGFTNRVIQERKFYTKESDKRSGNVSKIANQKALLDLLLENQKENKIDDNGIREEVDTFMFEGHDTTAAALCFMMMRIANEPSVQETIYEEIQRIFGDSQRQVTYVSGYRIPAGTICHIHVFDLHRNKDVYPEPERFIPERFLEEKRHPYAYIPFSAGPRNCIGMKFAMMELKVVMSSVLRRFRLEAATRPCDVLFIPDLVLRAGHPLYVRFVQRGIKS